MKKAKEICVGSVATSAICERVGLLDSARARFWARRTNFTLLSAEAVARSATRPDIAELAPGEISLNSEVASVRAIATGGIVRLLRTHTQRALSHRSWAW